MKRYKCRLNKIGSGGQGVAYKVEEKLKKRNMEELQISNSLWKPKTTKKITYMVMGIFVFGVGVNIIGEIIDQYKHQEKAKKLTRELIFNVDMGQTKKIEENKIEQVLTVLMENANKGDRSSLFYLGKFYKNGIGKEKDYAEALRWYKKAYATKTGRIVDDVPDWQIASHIGHLYEYGGPRLKKDYVKAVEWYTKAADKNDINSIKRIATLYEYGGPGIKMDYTKAKAWYQKAADMGDVESFSKIESLESGSLKFSDDSVDLIQESLLENENK